MLEDGQGLPTNEVEVESRHVARFHVDIYGNHYLLANIHDPIQDFSTTS